MWFGLDETRLRNTWNLSFIHFSNKRKSQIQSWKLDSTWKTNKQTNKPRMQTNKQTNKARKQTNKHQLWTKTFYSTQLTILTVLSEVPLELEETEALEVQIVLLIAAKQKVCSCISALQLKSIRIRNFFSVPGNREHLFELFRCICALVAFLKKAQCSKTKHDHYEKKICHVLLFIFTSATDEPLEMRLLVPHLNDNLCSI